MAAMWCSCTENSRSLLARWPIHFFMTSIRWSSESSSRRTAACACGHVRSSPKPIAEQWSCPACQGFVSSCRSDLTQVGETLSPGQLRVTPGSYATCELVGRFHFPLSEHTNVQTLMSGSTSLCSCECGYVHCQIQKGKKWHFTDFYRARTPVLLWTVCVVRRLLKVPVA